MPLIDLPPYVLSGDLPPSARGRLPAFHMRSYDIPPPVDFPRALFADALAEHARLLERHSPAILDAPLDRYRPDDDDSDDDDDDDDDDRFVPLDSIDLVCTLLVSDGVTHEIHKLRAREVSYVVQRCRGIVRQLMESPPDGSTYVVVVARDVASLHLLRGVAPRRAGDSARLEVVERDRVVEPWDQWHRRDQDFVVTWWRTPEGELAAGRVARPPVARTVQQAVAAALALYDARLRKGLAAYGREHPRDRRLAILQTSGDGEELLFLHRREADAYLDDFPQILEALRVAMPGFDAVVVDGYFWAALRWLPTGQVDVGVPPTLFVRRRYRDDHGFFDEPRPPKTSPPVSDAAFLAALRASYVRDLRMALVQVILAMACGWAAIRGGATYVDALGNPSAGFPLGAVLLAVLGVAGFGLLGSAAVGHLRIARSLRRRTLEGHGSATGPTPAASFEELRRKHWMGRLAMRLSRLERLVQLDAPEIIIDTERRLVRDGVAKLEPGDAQAVLRAWPEAVKHMEPRRHRAEPEEKAKEKPN